jgi:hypothetical protein
MICLDRDENVLTKKDVEKNLLCENKKFRKIRDPMTKTQRQSPFVKLLENGIAPERF